MKQSSTFSARLARGISLAFLALAFTHCGSSDGPAAGGDGGDGGSTGTPSGLPALFSANDDTINFNTVDLSTFDDTTYFNFLAGNDNVTMPNDNTVASHAILAGKDASLTFDAGDGNDTINASASNLNMVLNGGAGNDRIMMGSGNETINGGEGNDTIEVLRSNYNDGLDTINGGNGTDTLVFTDGGGLNFNFATDFTNVSSVEGIITTDAADTITAAANIEVTAKAGADILTGSTGNDQIHGGADNDTINGGTGDDVLNGDGGVDTINGEGGDDTISGGDGNDILNGGADDDTINGNDGDDQITMGTGTDTVNMGDGADTLVCSQDGGTKSVTGGSGNDTFQLCRASTTATIVVTDPAAGDVVELALNAVTGLFTGSPITGDLINGAGGNVANTDAISAQTIDLGTNAAPLQVQMNAATNVVIATRDGGSGFSALSGAPDSLQAHFTAGSEIELNGGASAAAGDGLILIWLNTTSGNFELGLIEASGSGFNGTMDYFTIGAFTPNGLTAVQLSALIDFVP